MTRTVTISLDQFYRPQPGRHRDLRPRTRGRASVSERTSPCASSASRPRGAPAQDVTRPRARARRSARLRSQVLTRALVAVAARRTRATCDVVHATIVAGPFGGGARGAVHSRGAARPALARRAEREHARAASGSTSAAAAAASAASDVRVFVTAPGLVPSGSSTRASTRRASTRSRLGVDDDSTAPRRPRAGARGCSPSTASAGPSRCTSARANRGRTSSDSSRRTRCAASQHAELGPLVLVGPGGLGRGRRRRRGRARRRVARAAEGPLPRRRGRSRTCRAPRGGDCRPSRRSTRARGSWRARRRRAWRENAEVVLVDPLDVEAIAEGLARALAARRRRAGPVPATSERGPTHLAQRRARSPGGAGGEGRARRLGGAARDRGRRAATSSSSPRAYPSRGVDTTLVTRAGDAARWRERSPTRDDREPRAQRASHSPRLRGAGRWARVARPEASTCGTRRTTRCRTVGSTPTVVTIHDLTFFTNPEWHERSKVAFFRRAIAYAASPRRGCSCASATSARGCSKQILPVARARRRRATRRRPRALPARSVGDDATCSRRNGLPAGAPLRLLRRAPIEPRKGLDVLLEAFDDAARRDDEVELWLAGQLGWGVGPDRGAARRRHRIATASAGSASSTTRAARPLSPRPGGGVPLARRGLRPAGARGDGLWRAGRHDASTVMAEVAGDARAARARSATPTALAERARSRCSLASDERARGVVPTGAPARAERFTWDACVDRHLVAYELARAAEMRALVTGSNGFVGSTSRASTCATTATMVERIDRERDVTDERSMREAFDAVPTRRHLPPGGPDARRRVVATGRRVHAGQRRGHAATCSTPPSRRCPASTTLVVSSAEVYGVVDEADLPLRESVPRRPGQSLLREQGRGRARRARGACAARGQRVVIARPFNHVGPGQSTDFVVPALVSRLLDARERGDDEIPVGDLSTRRDFSDVRDVVRAYRLLAVLGVAGEVYNVASGHDVALADVAAQLVARIAPAGRSSSSIPSLLRPIEVPVFRGSYDKLHAGDRLVADDPASTSRSTTSWTTCVDASSLWYNASRENATVASAQVARRGPTSLEGLMDSRAPAVVAVIVTTGPGRDSRPPRLRWPPRTTRN